MLTLTLAQLRGRLDAKQVALHLKQLHALPERIGHALALETQIMGWATKFARTENALFLGRGIHFPIAMEGALKLKEVSYIHAEGYAAGELKHARARHERDAGRHDRAGRPPVPEAEIQHGRGTRAADGSTCWPATSSGSTPTATRT